MRWYLSILMMVLLLSCAQHPKEQPPHPPEPVSEYQIPEWIIRLGPLYEYADIETGKRYIVRALPTTDAQYVYLVTVYDPQRKPTQPERLATPVEKMWILNQIRRYIAKTQNEKIAGFLRAMEVEKDVELETLAKEIEIKKRVIKEIQQEVRDIEIDIRSRRDAGVFLDTIPAAEAILLQKKAELYQKQKELDVLELKRLDRLQEVMAD